MGTSAREIEQQIKETRDRMDENLGTLERRAASNAVRVGKIAAVVAGAAVVAIGGFLLYRRLRRPTLRDRLEGMSLASLRDLADQVAERARKLRSMKVTVNEESQEPGTLGRILREVAPGLVGTASTALLEKIARSADETDTRTAAHRAK
jgi:hypothetical protein